MPELICAAQKMHGSISDKHRVHKLHDELRKTFGSLLIIDWHS